MMPISCILRNSSLATASFSPARRRGRAETGGPSVGTTCSTPCAGRSSILKFGTSTEGNSSKSREKVEALEVV